MVNQNCLKFVSGMEQVWLSEFHRLFSNYYQQVWILHPVQHKPVANNSLHTFVDSAKVRFCCDVRQQSWIRNLFKINFMRQKCGHGWTSMKGRVVFWFDLLSPYYSNGFVAFKLYGQQCDRCKSDRYEQAMWYPEEVCKVCDPDYSFCLNGYFNSESLSGADQPLQQSRTNILWLLSATH